MGSSVVSIIVPCYNQSHFIAETLDSVLAQKYTNWECVIINDGSIDNSEEIILRYCEKDERFVYLYQDNAGVVAARNNAIAHSHGKYILPLDGDDLISSDYLALAVPILDADDDVVLVYCNVMKFGTEEGTMKLPDFNIRNLLSTGCCVCTSMFRRKSFDLVGGYKLEMREGWEDWEFFISLVEMGGKTQKIDKTLFFYRYLEDSRNRSIDKVIKSQLRTTLVRLHPKLYYEQYDNLVAELNTRSYHFYKAIMSPYWRLRSWLGH